MDTIMADSNKVDEIYGLVLRIDERQKTVIKEIGEIKKIVTGNGLTKKVNTLEVNQENNEKWFGRIWKITTGIGVSVVLMIIGLLLDKLVF